MTFSIWFKPEAVQWIAPVAVFLILLLMLFFPWVGVYPGGQMAASQRAWQIVGGWYDPEPNMQDPSMMQDAFRFLTSTEVAEHKTQFPKAPGFSLLMLMYIPLLLLTVALTVGCAVLPLLNLKLPPNVEPLLQWRWAIVAVLNLFVFLVLFLLVLWGFPIESSVYDWKTTSDEEYKNLKNRETRSTPQELRLKVKEGEAAALTKRTFWLKLALFLHFVAIGGAALMFGLDRRGNKPPVHLDLVV